MCEFKGNPGAQQSQSRSAGTRCRPSLCNLPSAQMLPPLLSGTSTRLQSSFVGQGSHQIYKPGRVRPGENVNGNAQNNKGSKRFPLGRKGGCRAKSRTGSHGETMGRTVAADPSEWGGEGSLLGADLSELAQGLQGQFL